MAARAGRRLAGRAGSILWRTLALVALGVALCHTARAQVAILQIQVASGEGAVHAPGARDARAITVVVTDETGRPVEGAAVSFHLPDQGPSGSFVNGLRTEVAVTDASGRAVVRSLEYNRVPGRFEIRIVASKEQARAGTVSFQYIAGTSAGGAAAATATAATNSRHWHPSKKWLILAAVAGVAVAGGTAALTRSSSASATAESAAVLSIGPPSVTVSRP